MSATVRRPPPLKARVAMDLHDTVLPSLTALAAYLADEMLGGRTASAAPTAPPAPVPAAEAGSRDDLSEDELAALLADKLGRVR